MKNKFSKNSKSFREQSFIFNLYLDSKYGNLNLKILKNNSKEFLKKVSH